MVRSIIVADLLISDKSSVSSCVSVFVLTLIDFTVLSFPWASWLMSQLVTRLADQDSGGRHMQKEAYVHVACTCRRRTDHSTLLGYGGVVSPGPAG